MYDAVSVKVALGTNKKQIIRSFPDEKMKILLLLPLLLLLLLLMLLASNLCNHLLPSSRLCLILFLHVMSISIGLICVILCPLSHPLFQLLLPNDDLS